MRGTAASFLKVVIICIFFATVSANNILDFGAIPDSSQHQVEFRNAQALEDAIAAANAAENPEDRFVIVPKGYTFHTMPFYAENINDVTF